LQPLQFGQIELPDGAPLVIREEGLLSSRSMPSTAPSRELALADRHDAAGNHDEAINALALGTRAGNLACMRQLGKRLLTGDRAPLLAADGARFLLDAANQGDAEAAARISALTALGLYRTPSWADALRWLVVAAERRWESARTQLTALVSDEVRAANASDLNLDGKQWQRLAAQIDLTSWQSSPPVQELHADPRVRAFAGFISPAVCDWIVARARGRLIRARVYDAMSGTDLVSETRTNTAANFTLADVELLDLLLQARMSAACGVPMRNMEAPAVLHYDVGEVNDDHYDFVDPQTPGYAQEIARNGQRIVTFLVYLNDDYEGGETSFRRLGFNHKGRRGEGLFFVNALASMQPDLRTLHAGCPPTRGEKWIVSQFIRSRSLLASTP
jgi:prolyl 4-hydroxylase